MILCLPLWAGWPSWQGRGGRTPRKGGGSAIQLGHKTRNVDVRRDSHRARQTRGLKEEEDEEAGTKERGTHSRSEARAGQLACCLPACLSGLFLAAVSHIDN